MQNEISKYNNLFNSQSLMEEREERIRVAAYSRAERRGFAPGHELDDWLAVEEEVDATWRPSHDRRIEAPD